MRKLRRDEFIGMNGEIIRPASVSKQQLLDYIKDSKFKRNTVFYVGIIDLGSQGVRVNVPVEQTIETVQIRSKDIIFRWLEIKPFQNLEYSYEKGFKDIISANPMYRAQLEKMMREQKSKFILGAEERLKKAIGQKFYFDVPNKYKLVNFVNESKKIN